MKADIMVVKIESRREDSTKVQDVLSKFGCSIKLRLGLHETDNVCSEEGLLILQLSGEREEMLKLESALNAMDRVQAKMIMMD